MFIKINILLTVLIFSNFGTYYSQITKDWRKYFASPDGFTDYPSSVTSDNSVNVIVSSTVFFKSTFQDIALLKYSSGGSLIWVKYFNSDDSSNDRAHSVITDSTGNIILTGESMRRETGKDIIAIKYSPEGNEIWRRTYNGNGSLTEKNNDEGYKILVDVNGDLLVGGVTQITNSGYDFLLLKYDSNGNLIFEKRFSGPGNQNDKLIDMKTDNQGNVYLTGEGVYTSTDFLTLKYNSSGNLIWNARLNGTFNFGDYPKSLCVDNFGNVAVTGISLFEIFIEDIATVKYSPEGVELWRAFYNGTGDLNDKGFCIDYDSEGNFYVAGFTINSTSFPEHSLLKYRPGGNLEWIRLYDHSFIGSGEADFVKVTTDNYVMVSGIISRASAQNSGNDIVTLKYDLNGNKVWSGIFNGLSNEDDRIRAMHIDLNNNIYVAGASRIAYQDDILVYKYSQTTNITISSETIPEKFILGQNYPNPFNSQTVIKFSLPEDGYAELKLYDVSGKEVLKLLGCNFSKGAYEYKFISGNTHGGVDLPGGVYFYLLNAGGKKQTRKLVLLK